MPCAARQSRAIRCQADIDARLACRANSKGANMVTKGLIIRLRAKPGQEAALTSFLTGAVQLVELEPDTKALFMVRFGEADYGIVNAFPSEAGRQAHMNGSAAVALLTDAPARARRSPTTTHA